ncbi:MAG: proline dehydrogenase family protein [Candidatus Nanopelagicales bacterium]
MIRRTLLTLSRSKQLEHLVGSAPISRSVVHRFVAGETTAEAVTVTRTLIESGRSVTIDNLGEDVVDLEHANLTRDRYLDLLTRLYENQLTHGTEVSVKLSAVGQALPGDGEKIALENAHAICQAAHAVSTTVTLDMEDHTTTDSTLSIVRELRRDFPQTGAVVQAYLHRTEEDCRELAFEGSRVRLCKGAYKEPATVAFQSKADVDRSYVRCLKVLMAGQGYPMVASHDPRLIDIAGALAIRYDRPKGTYEYQMLYGVRPHEQERLAAEGETMRVYLPYGDDWYGYMVRRMAEKPANLTLFLKSLTSKN